MKLIELDIQNVRGIKELKLNPGGKNLVVWGANGSGKSAVVDAIDFLLTGRITRLTGPGTGNITLGMHGTHIDCDDPSTAFVRAKVNIKGSNTPIELQRFMDRPNDLICQPPSKSQLLKPIEEIARRNQHILTRREILKFITAEGGKRAKEIQDLMDLNEVEKIRTSLVKVNNKFKSNLRAAKKVLNEAQLNVNATTQHLEYDEAEVLTFINQNRGVLEGGSIKNVTSEILKSDLKPPAVLTSKKDINITVFERDISNLQKTISVSSQKEVRESDLNLRALVTGLHEDARQLRTYSTQQVVQQGLELLDESGRCPLCDTSWDPAELRKYLENKLKAAESVSERVDQIEEFAESILNRIGQVAGSLKKVINVSDNLKLEEETRLLKEWQGNLNNLQVLLNEPVTKYHQPPYEIDFTARLVAPENIEKTLKSVLSNAKDKYPESTPEQTAWDTLTRLEENLKVLERAEKEFQAARLSYQRATILQSEFVKARDDVLERLYDAIKDRFVELYRELHHEDENSFDAYLRPSEAALDFEVDFYGRGTHPPHALHSEGHQDSMGLCLFLALSERLTENLIDLIILDDVVMSVDADHRRELCRLLSKHFKNKQFLITTHDKTWANQLRSEGIVKSNDSIEFFNWNIDTGPIVNDTVDIWPRIQQSLEINDVPSAAARLRRGSEQYFAEVCGNLQARVIFKLNGKYELGDFLFPAMSEFKTLLKMAKKASQSWHDNDELVEFKDLDDKRSEIYSRLGGEQWAINVNVHYNDWANFTVNDFQPVVEAFKNLFDLFYCRSCNSILYLTLDSKTLQNLRCNCGSTNWNLVAKTKSN
jgi:energy-coupling factor transporter ATP-binding protein EcfA2